MRIVVDIPAGIYAVREDVQNGSIAARMILNCVKEAKRVRVGYWTKNGKCNLCGYSKRNHDYIRVPDKFCPNCGADMREGRE